MDDCRVEVRSGERVERRDDADVDGIGGVGAAEDLGEVAYIAGADIPGPRLERDHERQLVRPAPLRQAG